MKTLSKALFLGIAVFSVSAQAGSAVAVVKCKSASGRTKVEVLNQDQVQFLSLKFTIDGESISYTVDSDDGQGVINATGSNVVKLRDKVYTAAAKHSSGDRHGFVEMWAIPASIQSQGSDGSRYKFKANIEGTDPRAAKEGDWSPQIEVDCEYSYSI